MFIAGLSNQAAQLRRSWILLVDLFHIKLLRSWNGKLQIVSINISSLRDDAVPDIASQQTSL